MLLAQARPTMINHHTSFNPFEPQNDGPRVQATLLECWAISGEVTHCGRLETDPLALESIWWTEASSADFLSLLES